MNQIKSTDAGPALRAKIARKGARRVASVEARQRAEMRQVFDAETWTALLAEQTMRIASAAGVDPSKVKIRIGH